MVFIFFSTLVTSGSDGRVIAWDVADGSAAVIEGEGHSSQVAPKNYLAKILLRLSPDFDLMLQPVNAGDHSSRSKLKIWH